MTYILKETHHIRHENVTKGSMDRCHGRWWWGTDAMMTGHAFYSANHTAGDQTASSNLTGTRQHDGNLTYAGSAGNAHYAWGFPAGTFKIEHEILVTLSATTNAARYRLRSESTNSATGYSPQFRTGNSLETNKSNMRWIDYTENSTNYRLYKQEFELTVTHPVSYGWRWNDYANIKFGSIGGNNTTNNDILTMPFEDIKITRLS